MSVERLARDVGIEAPRRFVVDWQRAESEIGTRLPRDYKEYVYWFGPGSFDDYLIICVPGVSNSHTELAARLARERSWEAALTTPRRRAKGLVSPFFPEPGGFLPFGFTVDGDGLYWVTSGDDPDRWIVAGRGRGFEPTCTSGGFVDFLHTFVWDTVEMMFIAETEGDVPIPFEPDTGEFPEGGTGERLEAYGRFEDA
ncbi:SMI1/KNR4 family protein [Streptomyces sp. MK7]|uniref:SMI1/KNR4 family protein n=1 Tax=Streptomyces sp. MK7 TaxID=3067635 RepID=UPI00292F412B|nr:SMI1/KNR4 family protein [Streptomyces sp. MK7]